MHRTQAVLDTLDRAGRGGVLVRDSCHDRGVLKHGRPEVSGGIRTRGCQSDCFRSKVSLPEAPIIGFLSSGGRKEGRVYECGLLSLAGGEEKVVQTELRAVSFLPSLC